MDWRSMKDKTSKSLSINLEHPLPYVFFINQKPLKKKWGDVGVLEMSGIHNPLAHVNADTLFEYRWPPEGRNAEHYFLQVVKSN